MPKVMSKFRKSRKTVSKKSTKNVCNKYYVNKTQLNNHSLIDFDKDYSNQYYFSSDLDWKIFYNIQHKEMLHNIKNDIIKIKTKNNMSDKDINKIVQDNSESNNKRLNDLSVEEQEIQTIRNHFINLENLARQKFFKM